LLSEIVVQFVGNAPLLVFAGYPAACLDTFMPRFANRSMRRCASA
jgi:hypothetical protein